MADPVDQSVPEFMRRFSRDLNSPRRDPYSVLPTGKDQLGPVEWTPKKLNWFMFQSRPDPKSKFDAFTVSAPVLKSSQEADPQTQKVAFGQCQNPTHFQRVINGNEAGPPEEVKCDGKCAAGGKPVNTYWEATASMKEFRFVATFYPSKSWVRRGIRLPDGTFRHTTPEGTATLLAHEQGHFDLTYICARSLTNAVLKLQVKGYSCTPETASGKALRALRKQVQDLIKTHQEKWKTDDQQYESDTEHGTTEKQPQWQAKIATEIAKLGQ